MEPVRMLELKTCQCRYCATGNSTTEEVQTFKQLAISFFVHFCHTLRWWWLYRSLFIVNVRAIESQRVTRSAFVMLEMFDLNLVILFLMEFMQLEICEEMQPVQMQRKYGGI